MEYKTIFEDQVVTQVDVDRLSTYLKSWVYLNEAFMLADFTVDDLEKLITIELNNRNRKHMLVKLVGKRSTVVRQDLYVKLGVE